MPHFLPVHPWTSNPWPGMLLTLGLLGVLMLALKIYHDRSAPHAELVRKLLHIGMGLVTLTFPWLFASPWPVALLAGIAVVLLLALKFPGPLQRLMGGVVDGVKRQSLGEIYFPIGVAALFWLAAGDAILYCVPLLLLTLGDALAALVGVRYGTTHFTTSEGDKSVEGSLACFLVAFLSVHIPLLLFTSVGRAETLLISLILGLLVMMLEAIAWSGLDNLFLPLGGFLLLGTHLGMGTQTLVNHLLATLGLFLFVIFWRRKTTLNDSAVLGAALYGYVVWSVGGLPWLYAPVFLFVGYPLVWPRTGADAARRRTVGVVLCVGAAGLVWLFLAVILGRPELCLLYNIAFGAQMAMIGLARLRHRYALAPAALLLAVSVAGSWLLMVAPWIFLERPHAPAGIRGAAALVGMALAALLFDRLRPDLRDCPTDSARWRLQAVLGAVGSAVGLIPLLWHAS